MKVLIVTNMFPSAPHPTYGIFVKEQMEAIRHSFPEVDFDVCYIDGISTKSAYLKSFFSVGKRIKEGQYDLIHIHYGLSGLFLLNPFVRPDIPVVMTLHGGDIQPEQGKRWQVALTRRILKHTDAVVTLNDRMTEIAAPLCPHTYQIPCSVNTELFTPPADERRELAGLKNPVIVFPSDPSRYVKNYPLFCEVVQRLKDVHDIDAKVVTLKDMTRQQVARTLREADIMLMTSISEGSPQVVKEAMACNLPVISTKVGDVEHLLSGVKNSGWSDSHDPVSLTDKLMEALTGKLDGVPGREKIINLELDNDAVASKIHNLYLSYLS